MTTSIHAHKVLNMLRAEPMTREQLVQTVTNEFGADVTFHTCSREGFALTDLLAFFVEKQKVIENEGVWELNLERVCSH